MRTRSSTLRNREEQDAMTTASTASVGEDAPAFRGLLPPSIPSNSMVGGESGGMMGQLRNRMRSRFTLGNDLTDSPPMDEPNDFNDELQRLALQNLDLMGGRRSPLRQDSAPCISSDSFHGHSRETSITHPLNTLSLLPEPKRLNVLETLVRAFPINIPTEDFEHFIDTKGRPDLTADMKRYFMERKDQHRTEFEHCVNVFKSERPWEPKWFTHHLYKLLTSTKARPNVYQYMFDIKARQEESRFLQKWKELRAYIKWTILASSFLFYFVMICFMIEMYGDEGINLAVPVTLFVTIVLNKVLDHMSSSLPDGI
ncbi:hypothetical protein GE061_018297 [Apolygus lucorum]|uniref:Uncharacterized protein n=1 Tax=Apolygus lucorum TaxID=248454 RepID=A0A8S9XEU2_APOLU|nr:hypothetical protein GE061_018297 [Apolygus lucorum]